MYLNPPSSYYQQTSRSLVFASFPDLAIPPNCIRQANLASFGKSPKQPKFQNTLHSKYVWVVFGYKSPLKV